MKIFSATHDFNYPWGEVSRANWFKYGPWNRESSHVVAVDTLARNFDKENGVLKTERLITCKQPTPRWLKPFLGGQESSYVYEVSYVKSPSAKPGPDCSAVVQPPSLFGDAADKPLDPPSSVIMTSWNLTWSDVLRVREKVTYTPSPIDPKAKTRFQQEAQITGMFGWEKVKEKIEEFTVERFGQNAARGREGFQEVLEESHKHPEEEMAQVPADGQPTKASL